MKFNKREYKVLKVAMGAKSYPHTILYRSKNGKRKIDNGRMKWVDPVIQDLKSRGFLKVNESGILEITPKYFKVENWGLKEYEC